MAETTDKRRKKKEGSQANESVQVETGAIEVEEETQLFTPEEKARMERVKADIAVGRYSDITDEYKKLLFVEYLIKHGKLSS